MNENTKIEVAVEIMATKIARAVRKNKTEDCEEVKELLKERSKMYSCDMDIIEKIINIYGPEINRRGM